MALVNFSKPPEPRDYIHWTYTNNTVDVFMLFFFPLVLFRWTLKMVLMLPKPTFLFAVCWLNWLYYDSVDAAGAYQSTVQKSRNWIPYIPEVFFSVGICQTFAYSKVNLAVPSKIAYRMLMAYLNNFCVDVLQFEAPLLQEILISSCFLYLLLNWLPEILR